MVLNAFCAPAGMAANSKIATEAASDSLSGIFFNISIAF